MPWRKREVVVIAIKHIQHGLRQSMIKSGQFPAYSQSISCVRQSGGIFEQPQSRGDRAITQTAC
jgi:hypothetical protein